MRTHERWIWTELIGFDVEQPDLGVSVYLNNCGFTPHTICLLLTSPAFVLAHEDHPGEVPLPPNVCSRDGHEFGRDRTRQVWTNRQLRQLIANLQAAGVRVFLTVFTGYKEQWLLDHPETYYLTLSAISYSLNPLTRLSDGSYFQDLWARKLIQTLKYYGFDGWQGADGWGPLSGPLYEVSFCDDMTAQFAQWLSRKSDAIRLPSNLTVPLYPYTQRMEGLKVRADWIWRHARNEWIAFWADRWTDFWQTLVTALHAVGKEAVINSAWGRAPFEALYRYGVDYQRIAATGVDGMIVETVAAGLSLDPRAGDATHYDFLSMLYLTRAYLPDMRLIFLHNAHDIVEQWDALRHVPAVLGKEIYSLANVYRTRADGTLQPAADGFLVCLGDGMSCDEWAWLRREWEFSFDNPPHSIVGATVVWSDAAMQAEIRDFTATRGPLSHRLLFELMALGAPLQSAARIEDIAGVRGPLLVPNAHLLPPQELQAVLDYNGGPVMLLRRGGKNDSTTLGCHVARQGYLALVDKSPLSADGLGDDPTGLVDSKGYWDHMRQHLPSSKFLSNCVQTLWGMVMPGVNFPAAEVTLMLMRMPSRADEPITLRLAVKSKTWLYCKPKIDLGQPIKNIEVKTAFPAVRIQPDGSTFVVRVPPRGIVVLDVEFPHPELPTN